VREELIVFKLKKKPIPTAEGKWGGKEDVRRRRGLSMPVKAKRKVHKDKEGENTRGLKSYGGRRSWTPVLCTGTVEKKRKK